MVGRGRFGRLLFRIIHGWRSLLFHGRNRSRLGRRNRIVGELIAKHLRKHVPDVLHLGLGRIDHELQPRILPLKLDVGNGQIGQLIGQQFSYLADVLGFVEEGLHGDAAGKVNIEQALPALNRRGDPDNNDYN